MAENAKHTQIYFLYTAVLPSWHMDNPQTNQAESTPKFDKMFLRSASTKPAKYGLVWDVWNTELKNA